MMFYKIFYYDVTAEEILHCHNVPNKHSITAGFLKQTFHHHHSSPEKKKQQSISVMFQNKQRSFPKTINIPSPQSFTTNLSLPQFFTRTVHL